MRPACVIAGLLFALAWLDQVSVSRTGGPGPRPWPSAQPVRGGWPNAYNARRAWCPDHGPLRLRGDRIRPLWRAVGVRHVPPPLEHWADPGGGVLGNHAGHAADAHFRDLHRAGPRRPDRGLGGLRRIPAVAPASRRDGLLVLL